MLHVLHRGGNDGATPGARASASCVQLGKMAELTQRRLLMPPNSVLDAPGSTPSEQGVGYALDALFDYLMARDGLTARPSRSCAGSLLR